MAQLPQRTSNHILETKSKKHFDRHVPDEWVVNEFKSDYGTDLNVEVAENNDVTGLSFSVQLKSKETEKDTGFVNVDGIKRSTINRWLKRLEPTMITCYVADKEESFWIWFDGNTVDLTAKNQKFRIKIPIKNRLSLIDWNDLVINLKSINSRKHLLFEMPKLDFSTLTDAENIAWSFYLSRNYGKAQFFFTELLEDNSTPELWNALATCQYQLYHYPDALESVNKALHLSPDDISILGNKACILTEFGIYKNDKLRGLEGKKIFEKIALLEDDYDIHFNYANALTFLEEFEQAETQYKKALSKNSNYAEVWKNLGSLYHKMGNYEKEFECYDRALEIDPEKAEALMSKGTTLFKIYGNPKEALKLMLKSFEVSNDFNKAFIAGYFWISEVYQSLNDYENAGIWTSKGLKVDPGDDYLLNQQAHILCKVWRNQTEKIDDTRSFLESYLFSRGDVPNKYPIIQELAQIQLYQNDPFNVIWEGLLKPNVKVFEDITLDDVKLLFENENEIFEGIRSFGRYEEFRATSTLEKYHATILERLPIDRISSRVIYLINIALAYSYGLFFTSLSKVTKNESFEMEKDILEPVFNFLSYALPKISKLIYEEIGKSNDPEVKRQCCVLMPHISTVEIRLQLEDVIPRFNLNPEPLIEVFIDPSVGQVWFQYLYLRCELEIK